MKYKLMSLALALGLAGCKAETGTVMYVVDAPLPSDDCKYTEAGKDVRWSGTFDPVAAGSSPMTAMFRVHNSLNAKATDPRADDNGVIVRPDGNHIQLDQVRICYFTELVGNNGANDVACDEAVAECSSQGSLPCRMETPTFAIIPAEESSSVDEGKLVSVEMMHAEVMSSAFSGFDATTIEPWVDLGPASGALESLFEKCKAPGVGIDSPGTDAECVGANASQLSALGVSATQEGEIMRAFGARIQATGTGQQWGTSFGAVGDRVEAVTLLTKIVFTGQTVSGSSVESSPFIFPVKVCPGCATDLAVANASGSCTMSKVLCAEQPRCRYINAQGEPLFGTCEEVQSPGVNKYKDGCRLGTGFTFDPGGTDTVDIPCQFRLAGKQPDLSATCLPSQLLGSSEDYLCTDLQESVTCAAVTEDPISNYCGDGIIEEDEQCDEGLGNVDTGPGCVACAVVL
ncbi:MAG: hypothetical protein VX834_12905 [Myxococcota bacterium]|nr:hypothetical protein [Myxococcota bacterium]